MKDLKTRYQEEILPKLTKELKLSNKMAAPRIQKITINVGIQKSEHSPKRIEEILIEMANITGQQPIVSKAKKSIAGFNIRQGDPVGVTVTLRGQKMFDFLDKLCRIVLPQVKDFRGVKQNAFDGNGNYTLGLKEQIVFPEVDYSKVNNIHGLEITITTNSNNDEHTLKLLELIGMPFEKQDNK